MKGEYHLGMSVPVLDRGQKVRSKGRVSHSRRLDMLGWWHLKRWNDISNAGYGTSPPAEVAMYHGACDVMA